MATWNASSPAASPCSSRRRTKAPARRPSSESPPPRKMKSMAEIMAKSVPVVEQEEEEDEDSYSNVTCEKCGSGEGDDELLLCDKCDRGFHMKCLRPIVVRVPIGTWLCVDCSDQRPVRRLSQKKILHFFRIEKHTHQTDKLELSQEETRKRRRSCSLTVKKRRRKLLPLVPSEDPDQRLAQMGTLASALTALGIKYSDGLNYVPGMAPRSANQSKLEKGGMQVLCKEDLETLEQCQSMYRRGECPPLVVVFDPLEGYTVEADGPIKDLTFIAEYTGDVDYLKNREKDDCDSIMTLLLSEDPSKTLVICPDKFGNISRFINGINNHNPVAKKKQNCKCVRYSINGECRVLLVATRDISKQSCLTAYFGPEVSQMRDAVDRRCHSVLEDLLSFFESEKAGPRLKDLAPYVQNKCYDSVSALLADVDKELEFLCAAVKKENKDSEAIPPAIIIEKSLFMGRLLFALLNHSKHVPLILGSPRLWCRETMTAVSDKLSSLLRQPRFSSNTPATADSPGKQLHTDLRKQTSLAVAALLGAEEKTSPKFEELNRTMRDLCIKAHTLWIKWLSDELSAILLRDLRSDDGLSATTPLRGWEETIVKQEQDESQSELKISLPSLPSLYMISFLCRASEEIHRIGGHVLDRSILQKFASSLLEKITIIYEDFLSAREASEPQISEKGVLQILLDLRFAADVLSGGDTSTNVETPKSTINRSAYRRRQDQQKTKLVNRGRIDGVTSQLTQKLDPIDWLTYEPYLWENEKQSYLRHAVLFGFFVQLNRMYTDTAQKLSINIESNIMPCSTVPRFKYLPISAPALSSRSTNKVSIPVTSNDASARNSWKAFTNGEQSQTSDLEENSNFGVAFKSFMQESTLKLGSILTDGQVGIFKDRSAAAMSTFGDILPAQAAGLLSSFTNTRSE